MSERIETAALRDFSVSLCRAAGLSADDAALLTDSILFAECRGVTSHGLLRLPQYIARLRSGATASNVPMPFTMESGGTARRSRFSVPTRSGWHCRAARGRLLSRSIWRSPPQRAARSATPR